MKKTIEKEQSSRIERFLVKFTLTYFILYIYPYGFEYIYGLKTDTISVWEKITIWFGKTFIGWDLYQNSLNKGFDSKYDISRFLLIATLAILLSVLWTFINSKIKFKYDDKLKEILKVVLRYHVGFTLVLYGLAKVFMTQFGQMDINRLEGTIGDHSGMSFLWTFMSYSKFYTMTTGWVEVIGGALLLFRRTTFLGAFILFIAMVNVVIIDIGFDVSVKYFAIHLLAMVIVLLLYYKNRLLNVFVYNKIAVPEVEISLLSRSKYKKIAGYLKTILLLLFAISSYFFVEESLGYYKNNEVPSLTGVFTVNQQKINGDSLTTPNYKKWKNFSLNGSSWRIGYLSLKKGDESDNLFSFKADTIKKELKLYRDGDTTAIPNLLKYKKEKRNTFVFEGIVEGDTLKLYTERKGLEDYRLMKDIKWVRDME
ncbi:DoxX family protein [Tenacibaculum amylolyticum]|uniref:DoxX family protein n=1 Tax=Tenacibaculum amylolyticum TaxID=104269 RepID=UPI00389565B3